VRFASNSCGRFRGQSLVPSRARWPAASIFSPFSGPPPCFLIQIALKTVVAFSLPERDVIPPPAPRGEEVQPSPPPSNFFLWSGQCVEVIDLPLLSLLKGNRTPPPLKCQSPNVYDLVVPPPLFSSLSFPRVFSGTASQRSEPDSRSKSLPPRLVTRGIDT